MVIGARGVGDSIGLIGCGSIGSRHARNLRELGIERLLLYDSDRDRAASLAAAVGAEWVASVEEVLQARPLAVLVCTPPHLHVPVSRQAIAAGAHVFVEKPLSTSLDGTEELIEVAAQAGKRVIVGCNMRFHPGVAQIRAALTRAAVGRPWFFRAHYGHYLPFWRPGQDYRLSHSGHRGQGGGLTIECIHEIDYLRWLAGEVKAVDATRARVGELDIETEDFASLTLSFEAGCMAQVQLDCLRWFKSRGCEVVGENGIVVWVSQGRAPEAVEVRFFDKNRRRWESLYREDAYDGNLMYVEEMRQFLDCLSGASTELLDVADARRVLEIALAASTG
ncbi:MAG: Gfo/Idh/MocA family oxidoreductase [Candidatus Rokubacteria bacterium]|nr:Gfo/Idh/MocA family oxidoreductase [Candidatus Rokubacteria bacterium]